MPFVMTHLEIANNILKSTDKIKNRGDFLLGSVAPDCIHVRNEYHSDMKKMSHLCVGEEPWGRATNNGEWQENVIKYLHENMNEDNADFLYGYAVHILADIQNNRKIWGPFYVANKELLANGHGSQYHHESAMVDLELYLSNPDRERMWNELSKSKGYDLDELVKSYEIESMRDSILTERYVDRELEDNTKNEYVSLSVIREFIENESEFIREILFAEV